MNRSKTLREIDRAWSFLRSTLETKSGFCTRYDKEYVAQITDEERGHRKFCPDGVRCGLTVPQAVRLFAVKRILEYLDGERIPTVKDFLHYQRSCFYAAAFVSEFGDALRQALSDSGADLSVIRAADYSRLNKG